MMVFFYGMQTRSFEVLSVQLKLAESGNNKNEKRKVSSRGTIKSAFYGLTFKHKG